MQGYRASTSATTSSTWINSLLADAAARAEMEWVESILLVAFVLLRSVFHPSFRYEFVRVREVVRGPICREMMYANRNLGLSVIPLTTSRGLNYVSRYIMAVNGIALHWGSARKD
jgi:hypothetical protein